LAVASWPLCHLLSRCALHYFHTCVCVCSTAAFNFHERECVCQWLLGPFSHEPRTRPPPFSELSCPTSALSFLGSRWAPFIGCNARFVHFYGILSTAKSITSCLMAVCGQAGKGTRLRGGKLSTQHQTFYCRVKVTGV